MTRSLLSFLAGSPPPQKTPEEIVRLRTPPAPPRRLSRRVLIGGALGLGSVVAFALLSGLSDRPHRREADASQETPVAAQSLPEGLRALPTRYDQTTLVPPEGSEPDVPLVDGLWGDRGPPEGWGDRHAAPDLLPPDDPIWSSPPQTAAGASASPTSSSAQGKPPPDPALAPIFFETRHPVTGMSRARPQPSETHTAGAIEGGGRRDGFLAGQRASSDTLNAFYAPPASPYLIQAGAVIPAALTTALNSDLPGRVIAQVTAPVFDSVAGEHLLIPQGARLIGTYDSANTYGDTRVFLVWNRLIMPNGWSLNLEAMDASDPAGASGLAARTDNHLDRLGGALALSAVLSILANEAEDDAPDAGFTRSLGDAAAQEAARTGSRLIDRELNLRPTLRVRPGAPVRVLVTRDIELRPYGEAS